MKRNFLPIALLWIVAAAVSGCGSSGDQYPPSVPSGVQAATVTPDSVQLNWTASQDDLRARLEPLVASVAERRRIGAESRAYAERVHDLESVCDRLLDLYSRLE